MSERERFATTLDKELIRKIKILAINEKKGANDLLEEAIRLLLASYEKRQKQKQE